MNSPPGTQPALIGITGTLTKAETKRAVTAKILRTMKAAGRVPTGQLVRRLAAELMAAHEEPTDEQVAHALMAAPWSPRRPRRRHRVGEAGWRTSTAQGAARVTK